MTEASAPTHAEAPVMVVNAGSSSLKLRVVPGGQPVLVERIGEPGDARVLLAGREVARRPLPDAHAAVEAALTALDDAGAAPSIAIVGHRLVHGGSHRRPRRIDDAALAELEALIPLAPLHNPANVAAVRAARDELPRATHVAVFDTAFHADLPRRAYLYPLPYELYEEGAIRRYGFHGTSHDVVSLRLARRLGRPRDELRIVTLHLGNGASAAAVDRGRSVDTTMGFTPLEGLMMGTRAGDLDPGILLHLLRGGRDVEGLDRMLNRASGLLGLSGVSNDVRDVRAAAEAGSERAAAALEVYAYRIRKTIGAYAAAMGGLDAVAFTGGVGENDPLVRADACRDLDFLGIVLDEEANRRGDGRISRTGAPVEVWTVPTDEEGRIAELARELVAGEEAKEDE